MAQANLTVEELVQVLRRSNMPTILCEGPHDVLVYREVEAVIGVTKVSVLPVGGRETLLKVYDRRREYSQTKVAFFADSDMWLFLGVPSRYANVNFTDGYSIENDLLCGSPVESLLDKAERNDYDLSITSIVAWFAFIVEQAKQGVFLEFPNAHQILDTNHSLSPAFCRSINFAAACAGLQKEIHENYRMKLRGKTWLQILLRFLSDSKRQSKFSRYNIMELACKDWGRSFIEKQAEIARAALQ